MSLRDLNEGRGKRHWLHKSHFSKLRKEKLHTQQRQEGVPGPEAPSYDSASLYGKKSRGRGTSLGNAGLGGGARNISKTNLIVLGVLAVVVIGFVLMLTGFGSPPAPQPVVPANATANQTANQTVKPVEKPKLPDLQVTGVSVGALILTGMQVNLTATVKNAGDADAANVTVRFAMGQAILGKATVGAIKAGASEDASVSWTATDEFIGAYPITAVADPDGKVAEGNETNNEASANTEVQKNRLIDVSANFTKRSTEDFNKHWYSDRFRVPPKSGDNYRYFSITKTADHKYRLDVAISGFRLTMLNDLAQVQIQDASEGGWSAQRCVRKTVDSGLCIWNGPQLSFTFQFKGSRFIVNDSSGASSAATTADKKVKSVELLALKYARWPGELKTYKVSGVGIEPNEMIPTNFYEFRGTIIYINPLRWNARTLEAEAGLMYSLEITTG